jgi:hypothetical protein
MRLRKFNFHHAKNNEHNLNAVSWEKYLRMITKQLNFPPVGTGGYSRITLTGLLLLTTTLADETHVTPTINEIDTKFLFCISVG